MDYLQMKEAIIKHLETKLISSSCSIHYNFYVLNLESYFWKYINVENVEDDLDLLPSPSQLEDGSNMLIKETINVNIGDNHERKLK